MYCSRSREVDASLFHPVSSQISNDNSLLSTDRTAYPVDLCENHSHHARGKSCTWNTLERSESHSSSEINSGRSMVDPQPSGKQFVDDRPHLDISYLLAMGLRYEALWPNAESAQCDSCQESMKQFEGVVLKNCRRHQVCKSCLRIFIETSKELNSIPTCPVEYCDAQITASEVAALFARNSSVFPKVASYDRLTNDITKPAVDVPFEDCLDNRRTHSVLDSSAFQSANELPPRQSDNWQKNFMMSSLRQRAEFKETMKKNVSAVDTLDNAKGSAIPKKTKPCINQRTVMPDFCDKCKRQADANDLLSIQGCKKKHIICLKCTQHSISISRNFVRCPLYRECRSMMSQDQVAEVKNCRSDQKPDSIKKSLTSKRMD